jgi:hypothetical protein
MSDEIIVRLMDGTPQYIELHDKEWIEAFVGGPLGPTLQLENVQGKIQVAFFMNRERVGLRVDHVTPETAAGEERRSGEDRRASVDHPEHYGGEDNPYEAIKVIEAWDLNFNLGNTVKYISRLGKKPGADYIDDLEKALWYLQREVDNLKKES